VSEETNRTEEATWTAEEASAYLDACLAATPAQRLAWLEEALEFAYRAGALTIPSKEGSSAESVGYDANPFRR
jgi:hypothetical protein